MALENEDKKMSPDLERLRSGDQKALEEFVRAELPRVYNLCTRLCLTPVEAEDLCEDVFVRAIRFIRQFKGEAALSTWLHRITLNTWKNQVRYEKRRLFSAHVSISSDTNDRSHPALEIPDPQALPEQAAEREERRTAILKALNLLKPEDKAIIVLRDIEEKTYEEISDIMKINLGTVKSKLSRARDHLREICYRTGGRVS